ncbi:MAG: hypothetical protein PT120_10135 [Aphanizomenon gracile PMC649.10]|jgi:hypothetical protein|nr:hypothetical protein [Aphanizomenon gracile PMC638.10]MDM3850973.1 hypothetical protein [Aphanizomenon gracile PMC627.10]MDM3855235.1 hypothetical protein [Aphanizomenon gracile PMC649.10]MDM3862109.1 hypothetical protein [Aphanizomenon gracile PMC644.10]
MQSIKIRSYVGKDGMLHLDIPLEMKEPELEVTVTFEAVNQTIEIAQNQELKDLEWHNFMNRTYGCLADDPTIRYPQGEL